MHRILAHIARLLGVVLMVAAFAGAASATAIQRVESRSGVTAWLVEDHTVPMLAMEYAFRGGSAQVPVGKEGLALLLASMLNEGAGELTSPQFQEKLQELAITMNFSATRDAVTGSFRTLTVHRTQALELLRLALTKPRFDAEEIEQQKAQILSGITAEEQDNNAIASKLWLEKAFPTHPYGRPTKGTPTTMAGLGRDDVVSAHKNLIARDNLVISVVGDITAQELAAALDLVFGALPAKAALKPVADVAPAALGELAVVTVGTPQTVIQFGGPALKINDPDFIPAMVLNHVLGGGSFSSRLYTEVREKRGLTYGVYTSLNPLEHSGLFFGSLSTRNDKAGEAYTLIMEEIRRLAAEGPSQKELDEAKSYLIGSYVLGMDSSTKIAGRLQGIQLSKFGIDYINRRSDIIASVKLEDVRRAAQRFLSGHYLTIMVGQPAGVTPRGPVK